ncbi:MAG: twin-arginine translocation signal domain-containing protein, partial [Chlorobia bacterium]|nr:twin-arginine translocation signal domain-containing protein [Fimbriimonadaceae bacterium]
MKFSDDLTRRKFLQNSALATAAVAIPTGVFASGAAPIKVGLIGCGGRGGGAASDALAADPDVVIWSMGDVFADRLNGTRQNLKNHAKDRYQVTD